MRPLTRRCPLKRRRAFRECRGFPHCGGTGRRCVRYTGRSGLRWSASWRSLWWSASLQQLRNLIFRHLGWIKGGPTPSMWECQEGSLSQVLIGDGAPPLPRGVGTCRARHHNIGAQPIHPSVSGNVGYAQHYLVGDLYRGELLAGGAESCPQLSGGVLPLLGKTGRVGIIGEPPAHNLHSLGGIGNGLTLHTKAEAVEKLWT